LSKNSAVILALSINPDLFEHHICIISEEESNRMLTKVKISAIEQALTGFLFDCERFPTQEEGLDVLLASPENTLDKEKWGGAYCKYTDLVDP